MKTGLYNVESPGELGMHPDSQTLFPSKRRGCKKDPALPEKGASWFVKGAGSKRWLSKPKAIFW